MGSSKHYATCQGLLQALEMAGAPSPAWGFIGWIARITATDQATAQNIFTQNIGIHNDFKMVHITALVTRRLFNAEMQEPFADRKMLKCNSEFPAETA